MKILSYIIPMHLQNNDFVLSISHQAEEKGKLTINQENVLRDMIGIEEDFYLWDKDCEDQYKKDFNELKKKLERNRFKYTATKNACIRALYSILECRPNYKYINKALNRNFDIYRRYR